VPATLAPYYHVLTAHSSFTLVEEADYLLLHRLRTSPDARFLKSVDPDPLRQLAYIREARKKAEAGDELYFSIADVAHPARRLGFIRLADLRNERYFSFHSLIVIPGTKPQITIDALFTVQQIGFEKLGKPRCDSLSVQVGHERMLKIHRTMGIVKQTGEDAQYVYLAGTREDFLARRPFFRRLGFGVP
jgi:hypothetical protein